MLPLGVVRGPTTKRPVPLKEGRALARGILKFKSPALGEQKKNRVARCPLLNCRELRRDRSGQGAHPGTGQELQQNKDLITPIKVIPAKLIKDPGSFQVRDSRASIEQLRRETRAETAEADKIKGDFKVSHPTNKNLITLIKVIITELIKDPGSLQVRSEERRVGKECC